MIRCMHPCWARRSQPARIESGGVNRLVLVILMALLACKSSGNERSTSGDPCDEQPIRQTLPLHLCSEMGDSSGYVRVVDKNDVELAIVPANQEAARLERAGDQPDEILRRPGHKDVRVCLKTGLRSGTVGYVWSVHIFPRPCE